MSDEPLPQWRSDKPSFDSSCGPECGRGRPRSQGSSAYPSAIEPLPKSEIILYQTEDGRTRIQCRFENETLWLTKALISELYQKDVRTINEHLVKGFTMDDERLKNPPGKVLWKSAPTGARNEAYPRRQREPLLGR